MPTITNPILPGFHPDPSICRVGDDFYIATSTFEWFGGVQIHHSKDLVHWRLLGPALKRLSQLDMTGDPNSGGVWAPCLSYADGLFWLVYSDTKSWQHGYKDVHNYVVWCDNIESGEWSDPHYLNSSGFDPSLFHDDDGRKWVSNQLWDHRSENHKFNGIVLQEYDHESGQLIGPIHKIFQNTPAMATEGPHIYRKDGWYYLVVAEGGTGRHHCVSVARSKNLTGPYETHPHNPLLTSRDNIHLTLQKAGHGSWCDTPNGEWYLTHLCSRPLNGSSILGRETAIQKLIWQDDWPYLAHGGHNPADSVEAPNLPAHPWPLLPKVRDFSAPTLPVEFMTMRQPADDTWLTCGNELGLFLRGRESLASRHNTSLVARRLEHFDSRTEMTVHIQPRDYQHMAGLVAIYDSSSWMYAYVSRNDDDERCVRLATTKDGTFQDKHIVDLEEVDNSNPVDFAVEIMQMHIVFFYRVSDGDWVQFPGIGNAQFLADEFGSYGNFTGGMVGVACQDLSGQGAGAYFSRFSYEQTTIRDLFPR